MEARAAAEERETPLHMEARAAAEASEALLHMEARAAAEERETPLHMEARAAAEASEAPLHMEARVAAEESEAPPRTHSFLFGCGLSGTKRKVSFPGGGDKLGEQLALRTASLGPGARDVLHVLEVEGKTQQGTIRVPVATLRPSLLTSVYLGGLELTPPVTFWLTAGTGPLYISGQHLVALTESDAAASRAIVAEREAAAKASAEREAAKREAAASKASAQREAAAKASAEREAAAKACAERLAAAGKASAERLAAAKASVEREAARLPPEAVQKEGRIKMEPERVPSTPSQSNYRAWELPNPHLPESGYWPSNDRARPLQYPRLTVEKMKEKLVSFSVLKPGLIPNKIDKFRSFAHSNLGMDEPQIVQQLWEFVKREKLNGPPPSMTRKQMKELIVSLWLQSGRGRIPIPKTIEKFRRFAHFILRTDEPQIVQEMWEFVLSEKLHERPRRLGGGSVERETRLPH
ncbi:nucleophosmin-like [Ambystoma mexicanum]|uniref:nucleophosmin-like n=1 Tax=Ambystoma mexicanum TaxID=8296 RepID=UPI0037E867C5